MPGPSANHNSLDLAALRRDVRPFRVHWFSRLASSNDQSARMRRAHELYAPAIVLTSHQMRGRGRGAARWWSAPGSITATFALPTADHLQPHQVPLLAGLALREGIQQICGDAPIKLKWPNDLLFEDRKLAGLLCERIDGVDLIGVGINANIDPSDAPPALRARMSSLLQICGEAVDLTAVLATVARHVRLRISQNRAQRFSVALREYDRHHALLGREVAIDAAARRPPISGLCVGLDRLGRLLLRDAADSRKVHRIVAGHVVM